MTILQNGMTPRQQITTRWGSLQTERASWIPHWKDISSFILPRSGRFFAQDRNRGDKRYNNIIDNTGTRALRVLGAGLMSGATSPARPWFRLATPDPELNKSAAVKDWLFNCTRIMLDIFQRSNTYRSLHAQYEELGCFGTSAALVMDDYKNIIHTHNFTAGEYAIATDDKGNVNTLYREFDKTVANVVEAFGYDKCSQTVQNLYDKGTYDAWVTIIQAIEPRADRDRDPSKRDPRNMAFKSVYFEYGNNQDKFLRESGFKQFRGLAPRWSVSGGDIYGNSPGMECLGDIKQLQHQQLRKAEAIDYQTKPPLQVPTNLKNKDVDRLPGGITFYDGTGANTGVRTMFDVNLRLDFLLQDMQDVRQRITSGFYQDLFLMLATQGNETRMTATEVAERHEEKLLMLGPVLERLHNELLQPLVEITFARMIESGLVPPPPPELQGAELNVEFISLLAQAQRAISTNAVDRFVGNIGAIAGFKPEVLDKFNADKWADEYADMLGIDPQLIVSDEQVALVRQQRQQSQAQLNQAAMMQSGADAVNKLGNTPTDQPSALTNVMAGLQGYNVTP